MSENGYNSFTTRDRSPVGMRNGEDDDRRRSSGGGERRNQSSRGRRAPTERRVYVSNITYETSWQDLKDLFVKEVGEVTYVNLFKDEKGKARGCGIIEFATEDDAKTAVEKMNRYKISGRELVVKEDTDKERDRYGFIIKDGGRGMLESPTRGRDDRRSSMSIRDEPSYNTFGLNAQFLKSLGIDGRLVARIFVANLDYKVDEKKLKEVFKLAGKVESCEIHRDRDGNSRGYGTVEFEHPVEAVQAISMFKDQVLFDRKMAVRMDSTAMQEGKGGLPNKLPIGLKSIGMGLGSNGAPLKNVSSTVAGGGLNNDGSNLTNALSGLGGLAGTGLGNLGGLAGAAGLNALGLGASGLAGAGLGAGLGQLGAGRLQVT